MSWELPTYSFNNGQPPTPTRTPTSATFAQSTFHTPKADSSFYDAAYPYDSSPTLLKTPRPFVFSTPLTKHSAAELSPEGPFAGQELQSEIASHVHHTSPNFPLLPVEPARQLSSSPNPASSKKRSPDAEESFSPRFGLALDTSFGSVRSAGSMQTPPPTSTSATKRKAQQAQVAKLVQQSANGRRMSAPLFQNAKVDNMESLMVDVETPPSQFSSLEFSPDVFEFSMSGPATAPILPQQKLFWETKQDDGMDIDFSQPNPFDTPRQPALDPFVSAHHQPSTSHSALNSSFINFPTDVSQSFSMELVTTSFEQSNTVSTSGSKATKASRSRPVQSGVDPSLLFSSPGKSLEPLKGSMASDVILNDESLQPYAYQMQEAKRERVSGNGVAKTKKRRKPDADSPAVKAALEKLREDDLNRPKLHRRVTEGMVTQPEANTRQVVLQTLDETKRFKGGQRRSSPVKHSQRSSSRPSSTRQPNHRTSVQLTIDASGRARTETQIIVNKSSPTLSEELMDEDEPTDSDSDEDPYPDMITSQVGTFDFSMENARPPKTGRFGTNAFSHSQKSSYTSVHTAASYPESLPKSPSNGRLIPKSNLASGATPGDVDSGSEAETVVDSEDGNGNAQLELMKVRSNRKKSMSKQPTLSLTTITDSEFNTPSSVRSGQASDIIRCVCHVSTNDGQMICCESCKKSLHMKCVGVNPHRLPTIYLCVFCTGQTPLNKGVRVRQGRKAGFPPHSSPLAPKSAHFR